MSEVPENVNEMTTEDIASELDHLAALMDEWNYWPSDRVLKEAADRLRLAYGVSSVPVEQCESTLLGDQCERELGHESEWHYGPGVPWKDGAADGARCGSRSDLVRAVHPEWSPDQVEREAEAMDSDGGERS